MEQVLQQFVDRLVEEKGLENLDAEALTQLKVDLGERLENRINVAILERMPESQLQAFEGKLDAGNADEIRAFCQEHILNLDEVTADALMDFRRTYLGV